jgi:hypothetical protein
VVTVHQSRVKVTGLRLGAGEQREPEGGGLMPWQVAPVCPAPGPAAVARTRLVVSAGPVRALCGAGAADAESSAKEEDATTTSCEQRQSIHSSSYLTRLLHYWLKLRPFAASGP